jgi:hypothetical protein
MTDSDDLPWPADPRDEPQPTNGHDNSTTDITVTDGERHKAADEGIAALQTKLDLMNDQ